MVAAALGTGDGHRAVLAADLPAPLRANPDPAAVPACGDHHQDQPPRRDQRPATDQLRARYERGLDLGRRDAERPEVLHQSTQLAELAQPRAEELDPDRDPHDQPDETLEAIEPGVDARHEAGKAFHVLSMWLTSRGRGLGGGHRGPLRTKPYGHTRVMNFSGGGPPHCETSASSADRRLPPFFALRRSVSAQCSWTRPHGSAQ